MKKNIWIWNHYATNMYKDRAGRHYWFAENLVKQGYNPTIFCASTVHNSNENIDTGSYTYARDLSDGIPFVFVKTPQYIGNGIQRINNMISFYKNLFSVSKEYAEKYSKPDLILASSVHPLTLVAGIKIAKSFDVPCICEVRDLWPETLVAYGSLKKESLFTKLLYEGEKWIYKNADKLIFTMEGGKDYIKEKGWDEDNGGKIDINKITHINNGIDLKRFNYNKTQFIINDSDLNNEEVFKVVYTGSIRKANNVKKIVEAAHIIKNREHKDIQFLIFGTGTEKECLEQYCKENKLSNVEFKGFVDKNKIPYILSKCNLNIMHFEQNKIKDYGPSLNKMFEYFASGKPSLSDCEFGYDVIKKYKCGVVIDNATPEQLARSIIDFYEMPKFEYESYCNNAREAAKDFDFNILTKKLLKVLY
ncbi:glycosyltransferase family 4 protein [Bacillus infantis]|uniref:glycosyltransferase family 4 protein n=1 Tax=Bacillus infantis TaxID=324767 RepID=UPI00209C7152|nr:glycosyltransferase family 4 protein [Bacillus infantis]MCP1160721.1 glycosyltransferase family 4 protein [Bacillus infantis]